MAFNTLRGIVNFSNATTGAIESMVDDYSNQTIAGNKVFSATLSASAFQSDAGSIVPPAITSITGDADERLIISDGDGTATAYAGLTFDGSSFNLTGHLTASYFSGSAVGLKEISLEPHKISTGLSASNLFYGNGFTASLAEGNQLIVSGGQGITAGSQGVTINFATNAGLSFVSDQLVIDPTATANLASLATADQFLIFDTNGSTPVNSATIATLTSYLQSTLGFTAPGGSVVNAIQTRASSTEFGGSSNFSFDGTLLQLTGNLAGHELSASIGISASSYQGPVVSIAGAPSAQCIGVWTDATTLQGDPQLTYDYNSEPSEERELTVAGNVSASVNISASSFYGDGSRLTGIVSTATASGDGVQFARRNDGEFTSVGHFRFNTGSGAADSYLTSSNLVVSYNTHLTGALYGGYKIKNSDYTLTSDDHYVYFNTTPVFNLTASLPAASDVDGIIYVIKNVGSGELRVAADGSDVIDGAAYDEGAVGWGLSVQSINGSAWAIIHRV